MTDLKTTTTTARDMDTLLDSLFMGSSFLLGTLAVFFPDWKVTKPTNSKYKDLYPAEHEGLFWYEESTDQSLYLLERRTEDRDISSVTFVCSLLVLLLGFIWKWKDGFNYASFACVLLALCLMGFVILYFLFRETGSHTTVYVTQATQQFKTQAYVDDAWYMAVGAWMALVFSLSFHIRHFKEFQPGWFLTEMLRKGGSTTKQTETMTDNASMRGRKRRR